MITITTVRVHFLGTCARPAKAEPALVIDPNSPIAFQCFESIARRNTQVVESGRDSKLSQLSHRDTFELTKPPNTQPGCQLLSIPTFE